MPEGFTVRSEGQASILQSGNDVFFNPAQVINRDMSLSGGHSLRPLPHPRSPVLAAANTRPDTCQNFQTQSLE